MFLKDAFSVWPPGKIQWLYLTKYCVYFSLSSDIMTHSDPDPNLRPNQFPLPVSPKYLRTIQTWGKNSKNTHFVLILMTSPLSEEVQMTQKLEKEIWELHFQD